MYNGKILCCLITITYFNEDLLCFICGCAGYGRIYHTPFLVQSKLCTNAGKFFHQYLCNETTPPRHQKLLSLGDKF